MLKDIAKHIGHLVTTLGNLSSKLLGEGGPGVIKGLGSFLALMTKDQILIWDAWATALDQIATALERIATATSKAQHLINLGGGGLGALGHLLGGGGAPGGEAGGGVPASSVLGHHKGGKGAPAEQSGHNALGTNNWRGGLSYLAENGPELVLGPSIANLAPHSRVIPAGPTQALLRGQRQAPRHQVPTITGDVNIFHPFDGADVDRHLVRRARATALAGYSG